MFIVTEYTALTKETKNSLYNELTKENRSVTMNIFRKKIFSF